MTTFTAGTSRWMAIGCWAVALMLLVSAATSGGAAIGAKLAIIAVDLAAVGWAALWRPTVTIDDEQVVVRNVFRTVSVPWAALIDVDTKYALTLVTPHRRVTALAAPAPGRHAVMWANRQDVTGLPERTYDSAHSIRPGDLAASHSGAAALLVRRHWERLAEEQRIDLGAADTTTIGTRWHPATIAAAGVLAVATVVVISL
ncbi:PH domain-containing protein [Tersicoccus sp. MR15.9]|uniref:PH domain-containing protein n=1 Tax=Tersicoccus mangrovi TaxID=3121635 RepID=UPI002FE62D36